MKQVLEPDRCEKWYNNYMHACPYLNAMADLRQWTRSTAIQVIACRLFGAM